MKVISRPRGGGKTTDLLAQFQADPLGIYITVSSREANGVAKQCPPLRRDRVMSYDRWIDQGFKGMSMRNIYIDDVDQLLRSLLHLQDSRIVAVTFTDDQPEQAYDPEHDLPPVGAVVREGDLLIRWRAPTKGGGRSRRGLRTVLARSPGRSPRKASRWAKCMPATARETGRDPAAGRPQGSGRGFFH